MLKLPDPVQPAPLPVSVQVPEIVLLFNVPLRFSALLPFELAPDWIESVNPPV